MPITHVHTEVSNRARAGPFPRGGRALPARDTEFVGLQEAYRASGGIARGESLAQRMSLVGPGGYLDLARRIASGELFSFRWHDDFWLPIFQFEPLHLMPREAPRRVLSELHGALDGWAVAHWYVTASLALDDHRPLDLLDSDLPAVLVAARSARADARRCALPI